MRRWIISDTHFGHSNILKHCRRPPDADELIIRNWQRLVLPDDLVYHLGDVAWGFLCKDNTLLDLMSKLPGTKILIKGNHDRQGNSFYLRNGFVSSQDGLYISRIYLTHKPAETLPAGALLNVHGHLHVGVPRDHREFPYCKLYSLEYENYEPRIFEKFCRWTGKEGGQA